MTTKTITKTINPKMLVSDIANYFDCSKQNVYKIIKENNLNSEKEANRVFIQSETARSVFKFSFNPTVFSFHTVKGGVGKTTLSFNIGIRLWLYGAKVCFLDLDQQANLTRSFRVNTPDKVAFNILSDKIAIKDAIVEIQPDLDIIPSSLINAKTDQFLMLNQVRLDKAISNITNELRESYDYIIIDCPPAIGQSVFSACLASDYVISPLTPDDYGIEGLNLTFTELNRISKEYEKTIPLKILLNRFDSRTLLSFKVSDILSNNSVYSESLFETVIGTSQMFSNSSINGESIFDSLKQKNTACSDIDSISQEIISFNNA